MAATPPTYTTFTQAWNFLMSSMGLRNTVRAQQSLQNRRILNNYMAGRPLWK